MVEIKKFVEWYEVCNMQKSCSDGFRCVSYVYQHYGEIPHQETGYWCTEDWTICEDDVEQKTIAYNQYPFKKLSWTCQLKDMHLEIETETEEDFELG